MLKQYHHLVGGAFRIVDACVIGASWLVSYWLRFSIPLIEVTKGFPAFSTYAALTPLVMAVWLIVFASLRVYQSRRMLRRTHEAQLILRAHLVALLVFISVTYLVAEYKYSRGVILYFGLIGALGLVSFRLLLRNTLRSLRKKGYNVRHVLAVGEGPALETLISRIDRFPELGMRIIGVVVHPQSLIENMAGKKVLGIFSDLSRIVRENKPDQVVIALPKRQYGEVDQIVRDLADETLDIRIVPDLHEYITLGCEVEDFDGLPIVNLNNSPLDGWGAVFKRFSDILISLVALLMLSPIYLMLALLVKLSSRGPVFYSQERMGMDGRTFRMVKFRSMKSDAEAATGAVWAQARDPRRTKVGSFLRASSLDELPQFWNVLKGDMSLVGPRPERPVFVQTFRGQIPHYMLRHKVKAGITGWAQVNGWRGNTSLEKRIECDLYYIRNWSLTLDLKILFLTLWKGFIHKNAY